VSLSRRTFSLISGAAAGLCITSDLGRVAHRSRSAASTVPHRTAPAQMGQRKLLGHHATRRLDRAGRLRAGAPTDVEPDDQPNAAASPARIPTAPSVTTSHVDLQSSSCRTRLPEHYPPDRENPETSDALGVICGLPRERCCERVDARPRAHPLKEMRLTVRLGITCGLSKAVISGSARQGQLCALGDANIR
jgi:hypothetical protein